MIKSCNILLDKFAYQRELLDTDEIEIKKSNNTLENAYDIILVNEDYTVGNILNEEIYETFYSQHEMLSYVGFKKMHPHDTDSVLRIAFNQPNAGKSNVKEILTTAFSDAMHKITKIKGCFDGSRK